MIFFSEAVKSFGSGAFGSGRSGNIFLRLRTKYVNKNIVGLRMCNGQTIRNFSGISGKSAAGNTLECGHFVNPEILGCYTAEPSIQFLNSS